MIGKLRKLAIAVLSFVMVICSGLFVITTTSVKASEEPITIETLENSVVENFEMLNTSEMYIDSTNSANAGIKFTFSVSKTWHENASTLGDVTYVMYINKVGAEDSLKTSITPYFNGDFKGEDFIELSGALVYGNIIANYEASKGVDLTEEQEEKLLNQAYGMDLEAWVVAVITNNEATVGEVDGYGKTVRNLNGVASSLLVNGNVTEEQKAVINNYVSIEEKTSTYAYSFNKTLKGTIEYDELDSGYTAYLGAEKLPTTIQNNTLTFTLPRELKNVGGEYNVTLLDENGNGFKTKFNAYTQLITTRAEFLEVFPINLTEKGIVKDIKGAYLLGNDIYLGGTYQNQSYATISFEGIFDGQGHKIDSFTVWKGGVFSNIKGETTIKNVGFTNVVTSDELLAVSVGTRDVGAGDEMSDLLTLENIYVKYGSAAQGFTLWSKECGFNVKAKNIISISSKPASYKGGYLDNLLVNEVLRSGWIEAFDINLYSNIFLVHDNVKTIAHDTYYASNEAGQTKTLDNTYRFDNVATMTANETYNTYVSDNTNKHWVVNADGTATWGYSFGNVKESMVYSAKDKLTEIDSKNIVSAVDANGVEYVVDRVLTIENNTPNIITKDLKVTFEDDSEKLIRFNVYTDIITTKDELLDMMPGTAASGTVKDVKGAFILGSDITIGGTMQNPSAATGSFEGIFDGNGHKIDNFTIWNGGFFCKIKNVTTIKNVAFTNVITSHELFANSIGSESDDLLTVENIFVSYKSGAQAFVLWTNDAGFNVKANNVISISTLPSNGYKTSNLGNLLVKEVSGETKLEANVSNLYKNIFIVHNNAKTIAEDKYYAGNEAGQTKTLANTYRFDNVATMLDNSVYNNYVAGETNKHWVVNADGTATWGYSVGKAEVVMNYSVKDKLTEIDSKKIVSAVDDNNVEYVVSGALTLENNTINVLTKDLKVTFEDGTYKTIKFNIYTDIITTEEELLAILPGTAEAGTVKDVKGAYILGEDIYLKGKVLQNPSKSTGTFEGLFDGDGHKIDNFTIWNGGFFCKIKNVTTIKNVAFTNAITSHELICYTTGADEDDLLTLENIFVSYQSSAQAFVLWSNECGFNVKAKNIVSVNTNPTPGHKGSQFGNLLITNVVREGWLDAYAKNLYSNIFFVHNGSYAIAKDVYYASNEAGQTRTIANTYRFDDVSTMLGNDNYKAYVSDKTNKHWIVNADGTATWGYPAS